MTKARSLAALKTSLSDVSIPGFLFFTVAEWHLNPMSILDRIANDLPQDLYIVRSSKCGEDSAQSSMAGAYLSVPSVSKNDLPSAINAVIESYGNEEDDDEVLIQTYLRNVKYSGVAFSHDPSTLSPYRVVSLAEGSDTAQVTAGNAGDTWYMVPGCSTPVAEFLRGPLDLLESCKTVYGETPIDIEFAVTEVDGETVTWLLQMRPLVLREAPESESELRSRIQRVHSELQTSLTPHPFLRGKSTVFGVMPDWNPAEIIGQRPRPLALSLYRELITDSIWAYQRHNYGYRNLRSFPLMRTFAGLPYVDVRVSFNSFVPAALEDQLAEKLVDYYLDTLIKQPTLHDKVEFDIVYSCYTLDLVERTETLRSEGFSNHEIDALLDSLRDLTNEVIRPDSELLSRDAERLNRLDQRREVILGSVVDPLEKVYWLLEDGKRYGSLPFAGLARAAFMAVQLLRSLTAIGVFSDQDYESFVRSVTTVNQRLAADLQASEFSEFLKRYGHLRPGTYEILSPRYDEAPDAYFAKQPSGVPESSKEVFRLSLDQLDALGSLLRNHGIQTDPVSLLNFIRSAIELREEAKFRFTRNLSEALSLLTQVGESYDISPEEMSFTNIRALQETYISGGDVETILRRSIERGREQFDDALHTNLPSLVWSADQSFLFRAMQEEPNFITQRSVTAPIAFVTDTERLAGRIVFIPSADPGYDWIFTHGIAGLVTEWGGPNSHMAIRAGELGLPAVIGAGSRNFASWSQAEMIELDCEVRKVTVIA